jgi:DNA-binding NarL/FixJ family response regulator
MRARGSVPDEGGSVNADPRRVQDRRPGLSSRENEVLALVHQGLGDKEIARRLNLSPRTVRTHLEKIYRRWHVHNRLLAAQRWREMIGQGDGDDESHRHL